MSATWVAVLSLVLMLVLIAGGMHVAVVLGLVSFAGVWLLRGDIGVAASLLSQSASDAIASHIFGVLPLFVLTGLLVGKSGIGKDVFEVAQQLLHRVPGGLGVTTVASNAVFAAITGISIASAAVFTRVAVPQMLRMGYQPRFAVGVVAGSSVLGMLIPPSLLMILYGFLANQSVADLFTAGIVPGVLLATCFSAWIVITACWWPERVHVGGRPLALSGPRMGLPTMALKLLPSVLLIVVVLGGLHTGVFTATEAGGVGAALALLLALLRRKLSLRDFREVLRDTGHVTVAVSFLIICASIYTRMLAMSGVPQALIEGIAQTGLGPWAFVLCYVAVVLALGTVIDSSSILLIVLPLALPVATQLGLDMIWFGVITVVAVEIGLLTPPFGLSAYVVKSVLQDPRITLEDVFAGTAPFTLVMLAVLVLLLLFPQISLVLLPPRP